MRRLRRSERGTAIIEAAIVLPVLFLLLVTTIDFADWAYQVSQANGAARDGARIGLLHYQLADVTGSTDVQYINQAITKRLAGQSYALVGGTAKCVQPNSTTALANGCLPAIPGCDRIQVKVQWNRTPWSPFGNLFGTATVTGEADMTIEGAPASTATTIGTVDTTGCP